MAAALAGLNVGRLRVLAFVVSAACAGLAGAMLAVTTSLVSPGSFTLSLSIALLTGAVLGGLGTLAGALWGALVIVLVPTYVTDVATSHGLSGGVAANIPIAAYGVVLIVVMLLFPQGIQGGLRRLAGAVPAHSPTRLGSPDRRQPASEHAGPRLAVPAPAGQRTPGRRHLMNRSHRLRLPVVAAVVTAALVAAGCGSFVARAARAARRPRPSLASPRPRSSSAATSP